MQVTVPHAGAALRETPVGQARIVFLYLMKKQAENAAETPLRRPLCNGGGEHPTPVDVVEKWAVTAL